ncbi:MAG: hypothetical protein MK212_22575, partial [Saprospiraceae bacterium]|nr:hypothetical protein [Saprospiraceae bacterium]
MYHSPKPNYVSFAFTLLALMALLVLMIFMRPSSRQQWVQYGKESNTTEQTPTLGPDVSSSNLDTILTVTTDTIAAVIAATSKSEPLEQTSNGLAQGLGLFLLAVLLLGLLAYTIFRIVVRRWNDKQEEELLARLKLKPLIKTERYDPSDWGVQFAITHNSTIIRTEKTLDKDHKGNHSILDG